MLTWLLIKLLRLMHAMWSRKARKIHGSSMCQNLIQDLQLKKYWVWLGSPPSEILIVFTPRNQTWDIYFCHEFVTTIIHRWHPYHHQDNEDDGGTWGGILLIVHMRSRRKNSPGTGQS